MGQDWTFLTNHGHVLVAITRNPDARVRDIAEAVGITQRAVQGILADLATAGYIDKERVGRRNHYELHPELPMRHPLEDGHLVGELLDVLTTPRSDPASGDEPENGPAATGG